MSEPSLIIEHHDDIDWLVLNRPRRLNAFNWELRDELLGATLAAQQSAARAVVVTGSGRAFCAGADVVDILDADAEAAWEARGSQLALTHDWLRELRNLGKPLIAAVNGVAAGGGWALALTADVIVASTRSRFVPAFCSIGLVPDMGAIYFLPRRTGIAAAVDIFTARTQVDADEALRLGAVDYVVPHHRLREAVVEIVHGTGAKAS